MKYKDIPGKLLNELHSILEKNILEVDSDVIWNIKADVDEAINNILVKYNLIED